MISGVVLITRPPFFFGHDTVPGGNNSTNRTDPESSDFDGATPEVMVMIGYVCAVGVPLLSAVISILTRLKRNDVKTKKCYYIFIVITDQTGVQI
jgi:hypothetical protein